MIFSLAVIVKKPPRFGAASQTAIDNGIKINEIIKTAAGVLGGGGGGRLTLAQGAGKNTDKMDEAIQTAVDLIKG